MQKWQEQIKELLREHYHGDDLLKLAEQVKKANVLVALIQDVEIPSGDYGEVVIQMLKMASEELPPLAAVYAGFQLGMAWERLNKEKADAR